MNTSQLSPSPLVQPSNGSLGALRSLQAPGRCSTTAAFAIATAGLLVATMSQNAKPFYFDSGGYWSIGSTFIHRGHFSLLNFNSPLRGYFLPLLDHVLRQVATAFSVSGSSMAKTFNALVFALIATVLLPAIAELAWPERPWGLGRRLILAAVIGVLWGGFLAFPLSDFAAVAAALAALVAVAHPDRPVAMLVAGVAAGLGGDMRPAYIVLPVVMALLVAGSWWRTRAGPRPEHLRRAAGVVAAILGFAVISAPQSLASHHHGRGWSFVPGSQAGLSNVQYTKGMDVQLYNTYVGKGQRGPEMNYVDPTGARLLAQNGSQIGSTSQYIKLIVHHPITMLGVFARHVVNGLDQRYNTPYVEDVGPDDWLRVVSLAFVFLSLVRIVWPAARRSLGAADWRYAVAMPLAGVSAIAAGMEPRFMLPGSFFTYLVVLAPGWPVALQQTLAVRRRAVLVLSLLVAATAFGLIMHSVVSGATGDLKIGA